MKRTSIALVLILILIGFGTSIASAKSYISVNAGATFVSDGDFTDFEGDTGEVSFDTGLVASLASGGTFANDQGRVEIELSYRENDIDTIDYDFYGTYVVVSGDVNTTALMGNVYYNFIPGKGISPFIGGGLGLANVEGDLGGGSDDDTVFAYQLAAGLSIPANDNLTVDLQYRLFGTSDPEFDLGKVEYITHNIMAGLRFNF